MRSTPQPPQSIYAAFNEDNGNFTYPLNVAFYTFRNASSYIFAHHEEPYYGFVTKSQNDILLEKISSMYDAE